MNPTPTLGGEANLHNNLIRSRGKWPHFAPAARVSHSDSRLYSFGEVPHMDARDEDYRLELVVHSADPDQERQLADHCTNAINELPRMLDAMAGAIRLLDSVAFVSKEGDTRRVLESLRTAIAKATGPSA